MPGGRLTLNPLAPDPVTDPEDRGLVLRAKSGDAAALEELVVRHQAWIYNIAVRMLYHPQDAEDATQEILVKALTALSSYEGRSSFRTWLYRISVNHVLNTKRGPARAADDEFRLLRSRARSHARPGPARSKQRPC